MLWRVVHAAGLALALSGFLPAAMAAPAANTPTSIPAAATLSSPASTPTSETVQPPAQPSSQSSDNDGQHLTQIARQLTQPAPATAAGDPRPYTTAPVTPSTSSNAPTTPPRASITTLEPNERLPLGASGTVGNAAAPGSSGNVGGFRGFRGSASRTEGTSAWGWLLSTAAALGAVIGLILLLRTLLSRITGRSTTPARTSIAEVLSRINLGPRSHILVVRMGQRILVLGEVPAGLSTLADISDPEEVAGLLQSLTASGQHSSSSLFTETLAKFDGQYGEMAEPLPEGEGPTTIHVERARDHVSTLAARLRAMSGKGVGP